MPQGRSCCSIAPTRFLSASGESHRQCAAVAVRDGLLALRWMDMRVLLLQGAVCLL